LAKASVPAEEVLSNEEPIKNNISQPSAEVALEVVEPASPARGDAPKLVRVDPEPVIGSNTRQTITIIGKNLGQKDGLIVRWAENKKEFSLKKTPEQWQYVDENKIKLRLSTGTQSQEWQVSVKAQDGGQSPEISFDVVRPFISKMAIKEVLPKPFIGSDKRQPIIIKGQGFSAQTVIELKWDKNKKHFSSRLTPSQFEFVSSTKIKLFIATGKKERKWRLLATNPGGGESKSSFSVVKKNLVIAPSTPVKSGKSYRGESWIKQQPDSHYTIQLFGSHNKQAIDDLVEKHSLTGDILLYKTQKEGKAWFTMAYGNFATKQEANAAATLLNPALTTPKPWLRNFESIKQTLDLDKKTVAQTEVKTTVTPQSQGKPATEGLSIKVRSKTQSSTSPSAPSVKDEAWIWTQNPSDYTVQLIALSSKEGVIDYIKKYDLQADTVYFKTIRGNKLLYVLLYGQFADKSTAQQNAESLSSKIKGSKPWVRSFSAVHEMMGNQ
ncbi:MAG: hypothetical protein GY694_22185, partial [Gammaproteobacteria bacterium]|nr:hypothetical protein [Gammaproteobacteria bacterium]